MIDITIEIDETTTVNIKTDSFEMAGAFLDHYAMENSKISFKVLYDKEKAFLILHNWKKEFTQ